MQWAHQSHELLGSRTSEFCAWWENIVHCDLLQLRMVAILCAMSAMLWLLLHVAVILWPAAISLVSRVPIPLHFPSMWVYGWIFVPDHGTWWEADATNDTDDYYSYNYENYSAYNSWEWHDDDEEDGSRHVNAAKHRKSRLPLKRQSKWQSSWYRSFPRRVRRRSYMLSKH